ncbi:hypothetical protein R6Z07F_018163 [Ovis aries]
MEETQLAPAKRQQHQDHNKSILNRASTFLGSRGHHGKPVGGPDPRADWLPVSTGRGGRRLGRTGERKAAGGYFRSLWLSAAGPRLAPWPLPGFAERRD